MWVVNVYIHAIITTILLTFPAAFNWPTTLFSTKFLSTFAIGQREHSISLLLSSSSSSSSSPTSTRRKPANYFHIKRNENNDYLSPTSLFTTTTTTAAVRSKQASLSPTIDWTISDQDELPLERDKLLIKQQQERSSHDVVTFDTTFKLDDNNNIHSFEIPLTMDGMRLDAVVTAVVGNSSSSSSLSWSRSACGALIANGLVSIMTSPVVHDDHQQHNSNLVPSERNMVMEVMNKKGFKVKSGQILRIASPNQMAPSQYILPQNIPLNIVFEDEHMIVLNKAAGMVVHPAVGNMNGTIVNAVAHYLSTQSPYGTGDFIDSNGYIRTTLPHMDGVDDNDFDDSSSPDLSGTATFVRPGIVHRLDKGTTGILVVAKTTQSLAALSQSFALRQVKKTYLTITIGNPGSNVIIDKFIGRHPLLRQQMRVVPDPNSGGSSSTSGVYRRRMTSAGQKRKTSLITTPAVAGRRAISYVDTITTNGKLSFVQVKIETGRTHRKLVNKQKQDNSSTSTISSETDFRCFVLLFLMIQKFVSICKIVVHLFMVTMCMVYMIGIHGCENNTTLRDHYYTHIN
jgi:23S rRNA-/tRNA-specific pseudouridylate synthase